MPLLHLSVCGVSVMEVKTEGTVWGHNLWSSIRSIRLNYVIMHEWLWVAGRKKQLYGLVALEGLTSLTWILVTG